ncbi:hypothetical protein [Bartonella rochalimae]|uniref:Uncharacterized protein n=1 Tax=Bartonella rochalimae ATCC BAA-1498 TaxID=685782 RepID=E6YNA8_9HYPH|nr:hypothetical protein BARRO_120120 [Bartonella rochalimae ATCC BAA-1498]
MFAVRGNKGTLKTSKEEYRLFDRGIYGFWIKKNEKSSLLSSGVWWGG